MEINKYMTVAEVIQKDIRALDVFEKYSMRCRTCNAVYDETLETAAIANNISLEKLIYDLSQIIEWNGILNIKKAAISLLF